MKANQALQIVEYVSWWVKLGEEGETKTNKPKNGGDRYKNLTKTVNKANKKQYNKNSSMYYSKFTYKDPRYTKNKESFAEPLKHSKK